MKEKQKKLKEAFIIYRNIIFYQRQLNLIKSKNKEAKYLNRLNISIGIESVLIDLHQQVQNQLSQMFQQQQKVSPEEIMQYCTNNFKIIMPVQKTELNELNDNLAGISRMRMSEDSESKMSSIFLQPQISVKPIQQQQNIMNTSLYSSTHDIAPQTTNQIQNQQMPFATAVNNNPYNNNSKMLKTFITPFEKHHLQELVEQTETMIQLLLQNIFLAPSEEIQIKTYNLLSKLIERRDSVLKRIEQDHKLISYHVPFELLVSNSLHFLFINLIRQLKSTPQISNKKRSKILRKKQFLVFESINTKDFLKKF